jgi:hypothetical protein
MNNRIFTAQLNSVVKSYSRHAVAARSLVAFLLCLSLVLVSLRVGLNQVYAAVNTQGGAITGSQIRSEAERYQRALNAISGISTMKLDTIEDLKKANEIMRTFMPDVSLVRSKLILIGLNDQAFTAEIKKRGTNKETAEKYVKELRGNPNEVTKLNGAAELKAKMAGALKGDAAILKSAGTHLKDAADRLKAKSVKSAHALAWKNQFNLEAPSHDLTKNSDPSAPNTPQVEAAIAFVVCLFIVVVVVFAAVGYISAYFTDKERENAVLACTERKMSIGVDCINKAKTAPFPLNLIEEAACRAMAALQVSLCLIDPSI